MSTSGHRDCHGRIDQVHRFIRPFQSEDPSPVNNAWAGDDLPGYQVYVALNWLKTEGLLDKHGRQGYTAPKPATLPDTLARAWQKLPDPPN